VPIFSTVRVQHATGIFPQLVQFSSNNQFLFSWDYVYYFLLISASTFNAVIFPEVYLSKLCVLPFPFAWAAPTFLTE